MADGSIATWHRRKMPAQKPGKSKQDYATPRIFLDAVEERFGTIDFDLAATAKNTVRPGAFFSPEQDSLKQDWGALSGLLWLNPPYSDITPWARKCAEEATPRTRILLLTPASIGADWFLEWIRPHAVVLALAPRLSFDGRAPYPKDVVLSYLGLGVRAFGAWRWSGGRRRR